MLWNSLSPVALRDSEVHGCPTRQIQKNLQRFLHQSDDSKWFHWTGLSEGSQGQDTLMEPQKTTQF